MWLQTLTVPQVAHLVLRYFRADTQLGQPLAEHFSEVHLAFCYNKREIEMRCMTQFREVVENHVQVLGTLSTSDHAALTLILEKKMPLNGAITAKYKEHNRVNPHDVDDWEFAMRRFFSQVNAVRQLQLHVAAFGNPNDIYCHPARQNPYGLSLTTNPKNPVDWCGTPSIAAASTANNTIPSVQLVWILGPCVQKVSIHVDGELEHEPQCPVGSLQHGSHVGTVRSRDLPSPRPHPWSGSLQNSDTTS